MFLLATITLALASEQACEACCKAGSGVACPTSLLVFGEDSRVANEYGGWSVKGSWEVSCNGAARFEAGEVSVLDHQPRVGELVMQNVNPLAIHCFKQACTLPTNVCVSPADADGNVFLQDCRSGLPVDQSALTRTPSTRRTGEDVVVLDGKPLVVERVKVAGPSAVGATSTASTAAMSTAAMSTAAMSTAGTSGTMPLASDPAVVAAFAVGLPADPPTDCKSPSDAIRAEARRLVDLGDEKRVKKDLVEAIKQYRAAITLDSCSAYGWLGLGESAATVGRPDIAVRALKNATRLMPSHYGAWTLLGAQYEAISQPSLAADAYRKALLLKPDHAPAVAGANRVSGSP